MDTNDTLSTTPTTPATEAATVRPVPQGPSERTVLRLAGGGLTLSAVLLLLLDPGQGPDMESVTGAEALAYFGETLGARQWLGAGAVLALAAWLVSLVSFRQAAVRRQPGGMWGDLVLGAGLLVAVNWMLLGAVVGIPAAVDLERTSPEAARVWYLLDALDGSFATVAMLAQLLVMAGIGAAGLRAGLLHRPVAWFALVVATFPVFSLVAELAGADGVSTGFFYAALFGFVLVVGSAGVSLLLRSRRAAA
jgi:hypothetical protein